MDIPPGAQEIPGSPGHYVTKPQAEPSAPPGPSEEQIEAKKQEIAAVLAQQQEAMKQAIAERTKELQATIDQRQQEAVRQWAEKRGLPVPAQSAETQVEGQPTELDKATPFGWMTENPINAPVVPALRKLGYLPPTAPKVQEYKEGEGWTVPGESDNLAGLLASSAEEMYNPSVRPSPEVPNELAATYDSTMQAAVEANTALEDFINQNGGNETLMAMASEWERIAAQVDSLQQQGMEPEQILEAVQSEDYMKVLDPANLDMMTGLFERTDTALTASNDLDALSLAIGRLPVDNNLVDMFGMAGAIRGDELKKMRGFHGTYSQLYDLIKSKIEPGTTPYDLATSTTPYWEMAKGSDLFAKYAQTRAEEEQQAMLYVKNPETGEFYKPQTGPIAALMDFGNDVSRDLSHWTGNIENFVRENLPVIGRAIASVMNVVGHGVRMLARYAIDYFGFKIELLKACLGLLASAGKGASHLLTNDPDYDWQELEEEFKARFQQLNDVGTALFENPIRELQHKPKIDIYTRTEHEFEFFQNNFALNLIANSIFDPQNIFQTGTTQAGRLMAGSTLMAKLAQAFPDAFTAAHTAEGLAAKAHTMWDYVKPSALRGQGMYARVVSEARQAEKVGGIVPWVKSTAAKIARVQDDASFDRMVLASRIPTLGGAYQDYQNLKAAFRTINQSIPMDDIASRYALWGRLLTDIAASGHIPRTPGRLISLWATHPGFQKLVDEFSELPFVRSVTRGLTRMPPYGDLATIPPTFASNVYRIATAAGYNPRYARNLERRMASMPEEGIYRRSAFNKLMDEIRGSKIPTPQTSEIPEFLRRYRGMIPAYEIRPLLREYKSWTKESSALKTSLNDILPHLPKALLQRGAFKRLHDGTASVKDIEKAATAIAKYREGKLASRFSGVDAYEGIAARAHALADRESKLTSSASDLVARRGMVYPAGYTRTREMVQQRKSWPTDGEQETYVVGKNKRTITNPKGEAVPLGLNQHTNYVQFNQDMLRRARRTTPRDILHLSAYGVIGRAALQDFSNLANEIFTSPIKRIWLGRPSYVYRSWSTNMVKSFMWGAVKPVAVAKFRNMMKSEGKVKMLGNTYDLAPDTIQYLHEGVAHVTSAPLKWRRQRLGKTWHPDSAMSDPAQAITNAVNFMFNDPIGQVYIKEGRQAAKSFIAKNPDAMHILERWGIDDIKNSDAYFRVWDEALAAIRADAPVTFDALKYYSGVSTRLGRAEKYISKTADESGAVKLTKQDVIDVMKKTNEDFTIPLSKRRIPDRRIIAQTKAGKRVENWMSDSQSLYFKLMGGGIRNSRAVCYESNVIDIAAQLVKQNIPVDEAFRIASDEAINVTNELLMDFSKRLIAEKEFEWVMPFMDDLRLESFSYMKMMARRPHIGQNISRLFRNLDQRYKNEGDPNWTAYSYPINWGPNGEQKWISIPQFMMFPELRELTTIPEGEGIPGLAGNLALGQLGPVASGLAQKLAGYKPQYSGFTQYDTSIKRAYERQHAEQALEDARNNPEVKIGKISLGEAVLESAKLNEADRRDLDNRVSRSIQVYKNQNNGQSPSNEQIDQFVIDAIQSLSPYGGSAWLGSVIGVGGKFLSAPGPVYTKDEVRAMGQVEQYYGADTKEERNQLLAQYPGLWNATYKPEEDTGERMTPYEVEEVSRTNKKKTARQMRNYVETIRQTAFPGEAAWYENQNLFGPEFEKGIARTEREEALSEKYEDRQAYDVARLAYPKAGGMSGMKALSMMPDTLKWLRDWAANSGAYTGEGKVPNPTALARKWLQDHGYDENGKPLEKLDLWREWVRERDKARRAGTASESWYDFIAQLRDDEKKRLSGQDLKARDQQLKDYQNWDRYFDTGTDLAYSDYRYNDPQRQRLEDEYWGKIKELANLRDVKNIGGDLISPEDLARIDQLQAEVNALAQQIGELPQPNLRVSITPPGGSKPVSLNTEDIQRGMLERGEITPEEMAARQKMPTPNEEQYMRMRPEQRKDYMGGLIKATSAPAFGTVELTEDEAMALSSRTADELQSGVDSGGAVKVVFYKGKYYAKNYPINWLDPKMQEQVRKSVPEDLWAQIQAGAAKTGGGGGKGGYGGGYTKYRSGGYSMGRSWYDIYKGKPEFTRGTPSTLEVYYSLPPTQRKLFLAEHPELKDEFRKRKEGESDEEYTERLRLMDLSERYYAQPSYQMRAGFLKEHPDLVAYFEAKRMSRNEYWMKALARSFIANPELWNQYLQKQLDITDELIKQAGRIGYPPTRETKVQVRKKS